MCQGAIPAGALRYEKCTYSTIMEGEYCVTGSEKKSPAPGQGVDVQHQGRQLKCSRDIQETLPLQEGKSDGFLPEIR
jgi:hypothetical protein